MLVAENLRRSSYKALILLLKIIPMLIAFFDCLSTTLYFFDIQCDWISYIAGISLLPLAFIYLASFVFRFCAYHRMFIYYVVVNNILSAIDYYNQIGFGPAPYMIIACISLFLILYLHQNDKRCKKSSTKDNR